MIETIRNVINPNVKVRHQDKQILFIEASDDAKLKKIIFNLTNFHTIGGGELKNAIVVSSDHTSELLKQFSHFINPDCADITRKCDYIIFHANENRLNVILCELKSSALGTTGRCPAQFEFSRKFASYIIEIAKTHGLFHLENFRPDEITTTFYKIVFLPGPAIAQYPVGVDNIVKKTMKTADDGVISIPLTVTSAGSCSIPWRHFLEALL
ncbi:MULTISPECIES: hypothetical protein [Aeromonas]|uniref:Uncharacterized protein n=1 Tax=Aeromonas bestiarum TaxID=105751 RepID=A0ABT7Q2A8_9GAMM|nr:MULTISPECIES: hypothetical protein [Aeromonas]MCH7348478.1 hypothetical protein [Aeromonas sp. MR7]MDM5073041.1 hypothetical protein [Aeromonas bestiarum]